MVEDLFEISGDGDVVLRLHVQPGAGRTAVVGRHGDALKVRVAAPPEGGRANAACLTFIAEVLGVGGDQVELITGQSSRAKRVRVSGAEPDEIRRLLDSALEGGGSQQGPRPTGPRRQDRPAR